MNQLRAWLYHHKLYGLDPSHGQRRQEGSLLPKDKEEEKIPGNETQQNQRITNISLATRLRNAVLTVVPLAPGDCLECKLVGTGVMMISGIIVLVSAATASKRNPSLKGLKGTVYSAICGVLFVAFESTAICRLMDLGPFDKSERKHSQKN